MENEKDLQSHQISYSNLGNVVAHSDFTTSDKNQLSFKKGQSIGILEKTTEDWWWAELEGSFGFIPVNYVGSEGRSPGWQDEEYFSSYGNLKLHHEMLSDKARTQAYMDAILNNAAELQGERVLDVGCGTGILGMMCAKYGNVEKVYAVEVSEIAEHTKAVIAHNDLSEKVEVIQDYAENLDLDEPVDLIISEWMGTVLVFEMMIESVIKARDKHLKHGGKMWPSSASLFLVPCSAHAQYASKMEFWNSQYGFDFSCLKELAKTDILKKPFHDYRLPQEDCLSEDQCMLKLDMACVTVKELEENVADFRFIIKHDGILHGFCTWFEAEFSPLSDHVENVKLNTGPKHELTHWKQNLFLLDEPFVVKEGNILEGTFKLVRNKEWRRHVRVHIEYRLLQTKTAENEFKEMLTWPHIMDKISGLCGKRVTRQDSYHKIPDIAFQILRKKISW